MNKIELLAPAGDLEKLKFAVIYGADAVYIGGEIFGMRSSAKNFTISQMQEGIEFAHDRGVRVYLTLNIIAHNQDIEQLQEYLHAIEPLNFDAFIISDPGVLSMVKQLLPNRHYHLSTQANTTNYMSARYWHEQGIKRIILARELSLAEIGQIRAKTPLTLELEAFVHGAMCMSYSGRCLISSYLTGRDANKGACAHPCRWKYHLVEAERPAEYFPIEQDDKGTYFFNSKDLCMIEHIPQLIKAGLTSLKIEGRSKSIYYVSNVVRAYRAAIDRFYEQPDSYQFNPDWLTEIQKASHRQFTTGFYFDKPDADSQVYDSSAYIRQYDFIGIVLAYDADTQLAKVEQRNKMIVGDIIEVIGSAYRGHSQRLTEMYDEDMTALQHAPHAQQLVYIKMTQPVAPYDILRKSK